MYKGNDIKIHLLNRSFAVGELFTESCG